jgi:hypothetical protein
VEYETWFCGNTHVEAKDPRLPLNSGGDYSNVRIVQDGPPVAHAVAAGSHTPECGAAGILPHGFPWTHPVPSHWQRCPVCTHRHPVRES